jgi:mono/diheme cytochrome c family protein
MMRLKPMIVSAAASLCALAVTFGLLALPRSTAAADSNSAPQTNAISQEVALASHPQQELGQKLFERNCAHCHGNDARGDEGPSLHNLKLSDARIANRIKDGVKGEMPRFGSKLDDGDIQSIIAYLRTLKD